MKRKGQQKYIFMSLGEQLGRLLIHEQVSEDEAKMRISICEGCDLFKQERQCSICDCYMDKMIHSEGRAEQRGRAEDGKPGLREKWKVWPGAELPGVKKKRAEPVQKEPKP